MQKNEQSNYITAPPVVKGDRLIYKAPPKMLRMFFVFKARGVMLQNRCKGGAEVVELIDFDKFASRGGAFCGDKARQAQKIYCEVLQCSKWDSITTFISRNSPSR